MSNTVTHYTSLDAMLNIIRGDGLHFRATHFTTLNDSLEYKWSFDALKEKTKGQEGLTDEETCLYYEKFPYVISLSEEADNHLLWHLYGKCGYGVSMVLNREMLKKDPEELNEEFNDKGDWHVLLNVKYANDYNRLSTLSEIEEDYVNEGYGTINDETGDTYVCCSFLKREDWKYEKEVRYVVVRNNIMHARYNPETEDKCDMFGTEDDRGVKYYARGSEFVPYIDIFLPKKALTAIVIGSRLDFEKTKSGIKQALKELGEGYEDLEIVKSKTLF